jgi:hypothetical protein
MFCAAGPSHVKRLLQALAVNLSHRHRKLFKANASLTLISRVAGVLDFF